MERANADRIAGSDQAVRLAVIDDHRELRIEMAEHINTVLLIHRKDDLAVRCALQLIALRDELRAERTEVIELSVADNRLLSDMEWLHTLLIQAHDGQSLKSEPAVSGLFKTHHVRSAGRRLLKCFLRIIFRNTSLLKTDN